jgi:hypothetical protein
LRVQPEELKSDFFSATLFAKLFGAEEKIFASPHALKMAKLVDSQIKYVTGLPIDESISNVHKFLSDEQKSYDLTFGINQISQKLYDTPKQVFDSYKTFLREDLFPLLGMDFYYQSQMTTRLQTPHPTADVFYPMFHSDIQLGHPPHEFNIWIPLSEPSPTEGHGFALSTLQESINIFERFNFDIEKIKTKSKSISHELLNSAKLQNCPVGSILLFDSRKFHSTIPLQQHSRASIDIRVIIRSEYERAKRSYTGTGRKKIKFSPGFAYSEKSICNDVSKTSSG